VNARKPSADSGLWRGGRTGPMFNMRMPVTLSRALILKINTNLHRWHYL
jgi:hypothetical protein